MDSDKLLGDGEEEFEYREDETMIQHAASKRRARRHTISLYVLLALLLSTNAAWFWSRNSQMESAIQHDSTELTYYLQESDPQHVLVSFDHDWAGLEAIEDDPGGYRYGDDRWNPDAWSPKTGATVAVSKEFQKTMNLYPGAAETLDNSSNVHYMVAGYHQLHCLQVMRDTIYQLNGTLPDAKPPLWDHILHCVEAVRQALSCHLDPTLIPLDDWWPGIPNGQRHVCRNKEALYRWTSEHGHKMPEFVREKDSPHTKEWLDRIAQKQDKGS